MHERKISDEIIGEPKSDGHATWTPHLIVSVCYTKDGPRRGYYVRVAIEDKGDRGLTRFFIGTGSRRAWLRDTARFNGREFASIEPPAEVVAQLKAEVLAANGRTMPAPVPVADGAHVHENSGSICTDQHEAF